MSEFSVPKAYKKIIVSTRVRYARNLKNLPFTIKDKSIADKITKGISETLNAYGKFKTYKIVEITPEFSEYLLERNLISKTLKESKFGAAIISEDLTCSVMLFEEDIIRQQCLKKGFYLEEAFDNINELDDLISEKVDYAFSEKLGYLTACPSNVGTGLRASVMLFLPALTLLNKIGVLDETLRKLGFTVRGALGEGSKADGFLYQISNEVTLGLSEEQIISGVEDGVMRVCEAELIAEERLKKSGRKIENECSLSLAVLENSVLLSYKDFTEHFAKAKLGCNLGYFDIKDEELLDGLTEEVKEANVKLKYLPKNAEEGDYLRAKTVRENIKNIIGRK